MSLSASRRTWEEASSPAAVRLARDYEQAWRDSMPSDRRPDPQAFLDAAGASAGGPGTAWLAIRCPCPLLGSVGLARSGSPVPDHHSHSVFLMRPVGFGRCSTSTLITLPLTMGGSSQSRQRPRPCSLGCRPCQAVTITFP